MIWWFWKYQYFIDNIDIGCKKYWYYRYRVSCKNNTTKNALITSLATINIQRQIMIHPIPMMLKYFFLMSWIVLLAIQINIFLVSSVVVLAIGINLVVCSSNFIYRNIKQFHCSIKEIENTTMEYQRSIKEMENTTMECGDTLSGNLNYFHTLTSWVFFYHERSRQLSSYTSNASKHWMLLLLFSIHFFLHFLFSGGIHTTVFTKPVVIRDLFDIQTSVGAC